LLCKICKSITVPSYPLKKGIALSALTFGCKS
jgi:hypothetical protein